MLSTIRSPLMIILSLLPIFFIFLGIFSAKLVYTNIQNQTNDQLLTPDQVSIYLYSFNFLIRYFNSLQLSISALVIVLILQCTAAFLYGKENIDLDMLLKLWVVEYSLTGLEHLHLTICSL